MSASKFIRVTILNLMLIFSCLTHFVFIWLSHIFVQLMRQNFFKVHTFCLKYFILSLSLSTSTSRNLLNFISFVSCSLSYFITFFHLFYWLSLFGNKTCCWRWRYYVCFKYICKIWQSFYIQLFIIKTCFILSLSFKFINSWRFLLVLELI